MPFDLRSAPLARTAGVGRWLLALALATLAALQPAAAPASPAGVTLRDAGPATVRFTVAVPEPALAPLSWAQDVSAIALDGYEMDGAPGRTALPVRVVMVAVPPTGEVAIDGRSGGTTTVEGVLLATRPGVFAATGGDPDHDPVVRASMLLNRGRTSDDGADAPWAELLGVGWMRAQRVARVAIHPARYDLASRRLTVARELEVQVTISGAARLDATVPPRGPRRPDAFEDVYEATLVNAEQGRAWREGALPAGLAATLVPDTSVYAGRAWLKIAIPRSGFYKLNWSAVRNSRLFAQNAQVRLDSLRLFTWPGYPLLPEGNYCDSCDYREVAIQAEDGGVSGVFDGSDAIYFFALGPNDWGNVFDPSRPAEEYVNDPYDSRSYVFLTIADTTHPVGGVPRRIGTREGAPGDTTGTLRPTTFLQRSHFEQDNQYEFEAAPTLSAFDARFDVSSTRTVPFWEKWFWRTLNVNESFETDPADLPGADLSQPARFRALYWGLRSSGISSYNNHYVQASLNGATLFNRAWNFQLPVTVDTMITLPGALGLRLTSAVPRVNADPKRVDRVGFAWFDVFYRRRFEPVNDALEFESAGGGETVYDIGPFVALPNDRPQVFDVTDPLAPVEVLHFDYSATNGTAWHLRFRSSESGPRRYRVVPAAGFHQLLANDAVDAANTSLTNLRSRMRKADYLLVYFDGFGAAAQELVQWRNGHLPLSGVSAPYDTASVPVSALFDQFSGGRVDPTAIRNFLRAAYYNWRPEGHAPPSFVTLFGDASWDFKNILNIVGSGTPGSLVPSYEGGWDGRAFTTDDWLLNVDNPAVTIPDFLGGRIPAGDAVKALAYVRNKLVPYESTAPLGTWRNRVMLIADDNKQGADTDPLGWLHVAQTNTLDTAVTPNHIDRRYVYLHRYPDGPQGTKPGAQADIIHGIDEGTLMTNYVGHGSPYQIADERVYLPQNAEAQTNATRPTVFVAASCDVGKFNDPLYSSIGEALVLNPGGGAVGVISATEIALSSLNADLNKTLYREVFRRDSTSGRYGAPLAKGLLKAKTGISNNQKYQLMGDAAVTLLLPWDTVELTLTDANDQPVTLVGRGQTLHFRGRILDRPGGALVPIGGKLDLLIEDSQQIEVLPDDNYTARLPAAAIYRGDVEVRGGVFSGRCVVPVDAMTGDLARARGYLNGEPVTFRSDGVGSLPYSIQASTPPIGDVSGPAISLSFPGGSKSVRPDAVLRIDVADTSGVLITNHSPQNSIIVTVDGSSTNRFDVTSTFRYATNSYQAGTATFTLPNLSPGAHSVTVSAADNLAGGITAAQHRSSATIEFEVSDNPAVAITRSFLFPNPTVSGGPGSGGTFVVDVPGDSVNVLLRLYTVSGRLIRTLTSFGSLGQVQIAWDGLDAEGDRLANGVYLYRVHVNPREADGTSSARQKATGEGRFVIVHH